MPTTQGILNTTQDLVCWQPFGLIPRPVYAMAGGLGRRLGPHT